MPGKSMRLSKVQRELQARSREEKILDATRGNVPSRVRRAPLRSNKVARRALRAGSHDVSRISPCNSGRPASAIRYDQTASVSTVTSANSVVLAYHAEKSVVRGKPFRTNITRNA